MNTSLLILNFMITFYLINNKKKKLIMNNFTFSYKENCIYSTKDENAELKIIDFGFAKFVEREDIFRGPCAPLFKKSKKKSYYYYLDVKQSFNPFFVLGAVGTLSYVSPEVIGQHNYTPGADIWSLGVIMYILLVG